MAVLPRLALMLVFTSVACGPRSTSTASSSRLRVAYFPNLTHSQALIGLARGDFQQALGKDVRLEPVAFNAGPSVIEALFAGQIDLAYVGPNPAINGYVQSRGKALRVVCGATSGGAVFVVRPQANIESVSDLRGKRVATPQLGNTQDVAMRRFLAANGLNTRERGGEVEVVPTENPTILELISQGQIDGAWVPEPWASRLMAEGGATILLDERTLWPNGDFITAHIIVSTAFLNERPDLVKAWLAAHVEVTRWELANPVEAQFLLNSEIGKLTGQKLPETVIAQAWTRLRPTWDPLSSSLVESANAARALGFLKEPPDLRGLYDLSLLNEVLKARNLPAVRRDFK